MSQPGRSSVPGIDLSEKTLPLSRTTNMLFRAEYPMRRNELDTRQSLPAFESLNELLKLGRMAKQLTRLSPHPQMLWRSKRGA
jgi:hypothetical protein